MEDTPASSHSSAVPGGWPGFSNSPNNNISSDHDVNVDHSTALDVPTETVTSAGDEHSEEDTPVITDAPIGGESGMSIGDPPGGDTDRAELPELGKGDVDSLFPPDGEPASSETTWKPKLTPAEIEALREAAQQAKERGNALYREAEYDAAIEAYTEAIDRAPTTDEDTENDTISASAKARSTYYANRAACHLMMGRHRFVVDDCTCAVGLNPDYTKAYVRRAQAYEATERPELAEADLSAALKIDPSQHQVRADYERLHKIVLAKQEKEKEEMLANLKNLGNKVLGKFGMSLNDFQMEKNPETGSYSINMKQKGTPPQPPPQ